MEVTLAGTDELKSDKVEAGTSTSNPEPVPKIKFKCEICSFNELCDYKGLNPPFSKTIKFFEECYVMKDPFSPPPGKLTNTCDSEYFIVLGADCTSCRKVVCADASCSIFYAKTYCLQCAYQLVKEFPLEIQSKIRKLAAVANNAAAGNTDQS